MTKDRREDQVTVTEYPRRTIGIDAGSFHLGWGVVELDSSRRNGGFRYIASGVVRAKKRLERCDRLLVIIEGLEEVLREQAPQEAALEAAFFGKNANSALVIGEVRGAVIVALRRAGIPINEYAPKTIKKHACGSGSADKLQVMNSLRAQLKLSLTTELLDESDAVAGALAHLAATRHAARLS